MNVQITADIEEATRFLSDLEKKAILPSAVDAVKRSTKYAEVRAVRWYNRKLKGMGVRRVTNKKIRKEGRVYAIIPKGSIGAARASGRLGDLLSGSVYINEYNTLLSPDDGFTEADANSADARPYKQLPVTGQPFVFTGRNSSKKIWGKRHPTQRLGNRWNSHKAVAMYLNRKIEGTERAGRVIQKLAIRQFYRRFNQQINRRIERIRAR